MEGGKFDAAKCSRPFIKAPKEGNVSLRGAGIVLGLLTALAAGAQLRPAAAQFMQAMNASMERMDRQMASAPMNGDVDHDFAAMMIPHHQGAIDMAKAELIYGKDPVMRRQGDVPGRIRRGSESRGGLVHGRLPSPVGC